jgi:hypothetical protein
MKRYSKVKLYDLLLVLAFFSLLVALLPESVYRRLLSLVRAVASIPENRLHDLLERLPTYALITALIAFILWWVIRKLAPEIRAQFAFKSKLVSVLLQLHLLIFVPTLAYWFFYVYYAVTVSEAEWNQELNIVPWHNDCRQVIEQVRQQIPESDAVLLILEGRGTTSYGPFFNYHLYPRKVYIYRPDPVRGKITRTDINLDGVKKAGIRWILTYSGPRQFQADQLRLERIP